MFLLLFANISPCQAENATEALSRAKELGLDSQVLSEKGFQKFHEPESWHLQDMNLPHSVSIVLCMGSEE